MSIVDDTIGWFSDGSNWSGDSGVPARTLEHVGYSALTVGLAAAVAIPVGLWIGHTGRLRGPAVAFTGAMRALPTLGLLTWFVLLLGIGLTAPILALVVLAIPPLLAGAYSGLEAVDRQTIDAARAMGMTEWQILARVEIPLALPLLVGGIRSAVLQVVATATVAAYVGLGGLGRYIIDGQRLSDYPEMVAGSVLVIVLALVLDVVFVGLQRIAQGGRAPALSTSPT
ncbi:ABC transporter permease [Aeromicrobium sp.]|uniref:ABC transporter permease n=1 Tax=Aeromicrobium sp. TaxID=1871063 RepID=UPI003D6BBEFA